MSIQPLLLFGLCLLTSCDVPTIGSEIAGKPELADTPYPDINTVPFGEEANRSRQWHEGREEEARSRDKYSLEEERERMLAEGEKLRAEAGFATS